MNNFSPLVLVVFLAIFTVPALSQGIEEILFPNSPDHVEHKNFRFQEPNFRLPTSFDPFHYIVKIRPILEVIPEDLPQWSAPGDVTIFGTCLRPTTNITLHSQVAVNETSVKVSQSVT